ncbi:MAG: hypothetical protein ACI9BW_003355 [Gammaproteobacteria bacterium]|jgi:hypothetical protein
MRVNGMNSSVRRFTSKESLDDVIAFYHDQWSTPRGNEPGYTISNVNRPWTVISRIEDGYLMTVQVQAASDGSSGGFLSISRLPTGSKSPTLGEDFPSMQGSHTLNEVLSQDPGQKGRTMLLGNKHDIRTNIDFYRSRYKNDGWAFDMDRSLLGGVTHVFALRKGRKTLNLVITEVSKDGTRIIVNEVTHDIL